MSYDSHDALCIVLVESKLELLQSTKALGRSQIKLSALKVKQPAASLVRMNVVCIVRVELKLEAPTLTAKSTLDLWFPLIPD